jgi:hypothetical protein
MANIQTDVFVVDKNGTLNVLWVVEAGAWSGPLAIGPAGIFPPGVPVAASQQLGLNQTDVFVVDKNGTLNVLWVVEAGAWSGPGAIGPAGIFSPGAPVAASQQFGAANQTDVFVVDKAGQLNVFWVNNAGAWSGPLGIGPAGIFPPGAPVAASQQFGAANQTDVFVVDKAGQLNVFWVNNAGAWSGPLGIGPAGFALAGASVAASQQFGAVNQTDVLVVDKAGKLNVFWVNNAGPWSGPLGIGPAGFAPAPALVAASQQYGVVPPPPPPPPPTTNAWHANVTFSDSTPLGGWVDLKIDNTGAFTFSGHMHDSGVDPISFAIAVAIVGPSGNVYGFGTSGKCGGAVSSISRDYAWLGTPTSSFKDQNGNAIPNPNPFIATNWSDVVNGNLQWSITAQDLTAQAIVDFITQTIGKLLQQAAAASAKALIALL